VTAEGGRRRLRRRRGRSRRIGTRGYARRKVDFFGGVGGDLRQETECFVERDGGRWERGEDRNCR